MDKDIERDNKVLIQDALISAVVVIIVLISLSVMVAISSWESIIEAWNWQLTGKEG